MDIYSDFLLDLYKHPLNKMVPEKYTLKHKETNPLCGEDVEIFLTLEKGRVTMIGWQGAGCAISQAAASLTTDAVKGETADEIKALTPASVLQLLGLENLNPTRLRCALLALEALKKALA